MDYFRALRDTLVIAALLGLPFFVLSAHLKAPDDTSAIDRILLRIGGPVQSAATWVADASSGVIEDYLYLVDVKRDNGRLHSENSRLKERIREFEGVAKENRDLNDTLELRRTLGHQAVAARVIAKDVVSSFRVVRVVVDRGAADRVKAGMPVISPEGLVGQVRRSHDRYSDVLLTADIDSRIDVVVRRTGARGRVEGIGDRGRYLCRIQFDRHDDEVQVGDEIFTSGLGKKFPAGILVGRISSVGEQELGLHQEGEVTPAVDFTRLSNVLILSRTASGSP